MANPNSPLTKIRFILAQKLDPYPDRGEAWCMGCALNDGRTLILNAAGHVDHVEKHRDESTGRTATSIAMRVNWGEVSPSEGENLP
jgi:hypothetical protein